MDIKLLDDIDEIDALCGFEYKNELFTFISFDERQFWIDNVTGEILDLVILANNDSDIF